MKINVEDLARASNLLFEHLQKEGVNVIDIDADYYWNIPKEQRYEPYTEPSQFNLGQLTDDLQEVTAILNGEKEPTGYALVWLSALMRSVGENVLL
jgi:hypothetical protein